MKEDLESPISAPLLDQVIANLAAEMHHIQGILLAVVHNLSRGVNLQRMHLEALRLLASFLGLAEGPLEEAPTT
jgi:hypothetical protein